MDGGDGGTNASAVKVVDLCYVYFKHTQTQRR